MKILRFYDWHEYFSDFPAFLEEHSDDSFEETIKHACHKGFITPGLFSESMIELGYECYDFIGNAPSLIKKWCIEKGYDYKMDKFQSLCQAIQHYKPSILFLERDCATYDYEWKQEFKARFPFLKCIAGRWGAQTRDEWVPLFRGIDIMFAIDSSLKKKFQPFIPLVYISRPGVDEKFCTYIPFEQKKYLFTFTGTSGHGMTDHMDRYRMLIQMLKRTPLTFFCNEPLSLSSKILHKTLFHKLLQLIGPRKCAAFFINRDILEIEFLFNELKKLKTVISKKPITDFNLFAHQMPIKYLFPKKILPPVFGKDYFNVLMNSKISLNIHVDQKDISGNFRTFEAAVAGSCLLTDRGDLMKDVFELDEEIVSYSSYEEAYEKFVFLERNPKKCEEISIKGQKRALKDHTTFERCKFIIGEIEKFLYSSITL